MKKSLKWAIAAASVLVLSVLSVQGTDAAWRDSAPITDATITSGRLDLTVGQGSSGVKAYPFTALAGAQMVPGAYAQAPLTVFNSGNVEMEYTLTGVLQTDSSVAMSLSVVKVDSAGDCQTTGDPVGTSLYSGAMASANTPVRSVSAGGNEVLCVRATMESNVPDKSNQLTLQFRAETVV